MGQEKALVQFRGRPFIEHAIGILNSAGVEVLIAGGALNHLKNFAPTVCDLGTSEGPLGGICGAFAVTGATWLQFISVDVPMLPPALLASLQKVAHVTGDPIVIASVNSFAQTFPAIIHRDAFSALKSELDAGRRGCFSAFQAAARSLGKNLRVIPTEFLVQTGQVEHPDGLPAARWFFNVNSPSDLSFAHSLSKGLPA